MIQLIIFEVLSLNNLTFGYSYTTYIICLCFVLLLFVNCRRPRGIPPGPPLLPVIGNILTLSAKDIQGAMKKLRDKYGDIFSLYIGKELVIVLNGYDTIQNALVRRGRLFSHRPESAFQKVIMPFTGILFSNGKIWKEQRSFAQKTLKEICFDDGNHHIEAVLREETDRVLQKLDEIGHCALDIRHLIHVYSLNVIIRVVYGDELKGDNENTAYLIDAYHDIGMEVAKMQVMVNCFPFLQRLPGDSLGIQRLETMRNKLESVTKQFIHNAIKKTERCAKSYTDAYNEELKQSKNGEKDIGHSFSELRMVHSCSDLIGAASDTTANAIVWILLHLVREPEVQEKMFNEIKETLGTESEPMLCDRKGLPYTQAVILEGMRISNSTPFALPHSVAEDVFFNSYFFPKDCTVLVNLTSVLKDPKVFKDPHSFKPERFLNSDRSEMIHIEELIPFSMGPRSCLGESLARMQLFMIISAIVQKFKLLPAEDGKLPDDKGVLSTVYKPLPFSVRLEKR
ncbi:cytochrome P450 2H1-like [Mercenaria mercenaria]|uniref:cytochrome P450 2H1-like n=1 Tax=Mercenaria mercenaria TaxID=6596 RepID=UPI00234E8981|nr:cytochrome P450 2H1-like [Mercenaria mercenaria]